MPPDSDFSLGIDIGGTKIQATVFGSNMKPVAMEKERTQKGIQSQNFAQMIFETGIKAAQNAGISVSDLKAIGTAVAAPIDYASGSVIEAPNIGLRNYPLRQKLADLFKKDVSVENDVQAGIIGEWHCGALKGSKIAAGIFIGTGIGGGIIIDGKTFRGVNGLAAEFGHMILLEGGPLCGCGGYGHLEALASRTAMAKDAVAGALAGKLPVAYSVAGTDMGNYKSSVLEKSFKAGENWTIKIVERSARWIGVAMANIAFIIDPEMIVLGGGVVNRFGEYYRNIAEHEMRIRLIKGFEKVKIVLSDLKDDAVTTGAALIALSGKGDPE